jgi:hypothetical protein
MAATIRPLGQRRRTAQRGKPMSQSQRWGKVVTMMPVPEGEITTSEILQTEVELAEELLVTDDETLVKVLEEADAEVGVVELEIEDEK